MKAVVVGAGISGMTAAVLLKDAGWDVEVFESRSQIGGNCHDTMIDSCLVHPYGPHIFHTNNGSVWEFLNRFTEFVPYKHRVVARTSYYPDMLLPIPYNKKTEDLLGRELSDDEIRKFFFIDYSEKMWGVPWEKLPDSVRNRVPTRRQDDNDLYFTDVYQGLPTYGYRYMFWKMSAYIGSKNIHINSSRKAWRNFKADVVVYTGSLDEYHGGVLGWLPYRSLNIVQSFEAPRKDTDVAVVNDCTRNPYTRVTEYSKLCYHVEDPGKAKPKDPVVVPYTTEYPIQWRVGMERYYPMKWGAGEYLHRKYLNLTSELNIIFCGRLGTYEYMNIDVAVADTMNKVEEFIA